MKPIGASVSVNIGTFFRANGILREAAARRYWTLMDLTFCNYQVPHGVRLDGVLTSVVPDEFMSAQSRLQAAGCPIVRMGDLPHPNDDTIPAVLHDHQMAGQLTAIHYAERGFRHVGLVGFSPPGDFEIAYTGFRNQAESMGMTCHEYRFKPRLSEAVDAKHIRRQSEQQAWVQQLPKPIGILLTSELIAAGFCAVIQAVGIRIPLDVAVITHGNNRNISECAVPRLSTVDFDHEKQVETALDLLDDLIHGKAVPKKPIWIAPSGVVERQSTNVLATEDRLIARTLAYMWDHLQHNLSVEDIARHAGISVRQLERRFRDAIGRSVNTELRRKRLEETKRLLRETDLPVVDISPMIGFRSVNYLHRAFQAAFGTTPRRYRLRHGRQG